MAKRDRYRRLREDRDRLRPFVRRGALAFDVGANVGDMAALYLDLGARVVAVEPIPDFARHVRRRLRIPVEEAAVGASPGELALRVGRKPIHSTLSDAYAERFPERFSRRTITVPVVTLDDLIRRYGLPAFVKIDVEGYEPEVLRGLSHPVDVVVFEFQVELLERAEECVTLLGELGPYRFQFGENSPEGSTELWPEAPAAGGDVLSRIRETLRPAAYGDLYACRCGSAPAAREPPLQTVHE